MKSMEEKIIREGEVLPGNILKVGNFLNQQIDTDFLKEIGSEIARLYKDSGVNKVFTIEASGIAIAVAAAYELGVPVVFAKKNRSDNISGGTYTTKVDSFTHKTTNVIVVSQEFIKAEDKILIVDDFLANGNALLGLCNIVKQAGAEVVGAAIAIEKGFQKGGDALRETGMRVESLAIVDAMTKDGIVFRSQD